MRNADIKRIVTAALLAAMTCIATMIIKIPTPTLGYIHLGDGFVLLCGIVLGPWGGVLAAGIVSSAAGIPFNIVQGAAGILICILLLPVLSKIPDVRDWLET